jgi:hypothetical protein
VRRHLLTDARAPFPRPHRRRLRNIVVKSSRRWEPWQRAFATAAGQLGHAEPAVRLAGVYTMAGLADDWEHGRQTCIDVLCAYLRMPYEPDPGPDAPAAERLAFGRNQEVRHAIIKLIATHLRADTPISWQGPSQAGHHRRTDRNDQPDHPATAQPEGHLPGTIHHTPATDHSV